MSDALENAFGKPFAAIAAKKNSRKESIWNSRKESNYWGLFFA